MNSRPTWVRWRITAVLIFASFVDYCLRFNLSIAAGSMMSDLGLSEIQWGWVMAAFPLGYALFQLPGGMAADRWGPRRVLTTIGIAWGVLVLLTAAVPGPALVATSVTIALLVVVEFLVGATHAPIYPTVNCVVQRWFPPGRWALPNGLTSTGLTWGSAAITPVLAALIIAFGWRVAFLAIAPLAFIAVLLGWWYLRDFPQGHWAVNQAERELIQSGRGAAVSNTPGQPDRDWLQVLRNRDLLLLMLAYSCMNYGYYTAFSWFFYYLDSVRQVGGNLAITVTSLQWIAGGLAAALGGWCCDWLCRRVGFRWGCRGPVVFAMLASGTALLLGLLSGSATIAAALFVAYFFFNQFTEGPFWTASIAIGRELAGSAGGVMNTGANLMGVIMTLAAPVIADRLGWTVAMGTAVPFAFLAALLMLFVRADRPLLERTASIPDAVRSA